jgi:hypothetical protein
MDEGFGSRTEAIRARKRARAQDYELAQSKANKDALQAIALALEKSEGAAIEWKGHWSVVIEKELKDANCKFEPQNLASVKKKKKVGRVGNVVLSRETSWGIHNTKEELAEDIKRLQNKDDFGPVIKMMQQWKEMHSHFATAAPISKVLLFLKAHGFTLVRESTEL